MVEEKLEFGLQSGIVGGNGSLALEGGDRVRYEIFNLGKFSQHYYYYNLNKFKASRPITSYNSDWCGLIKECSMSAAGEVSEAAFDRQWRQCQQLSKMSNSCL